MTVDRNALTRCFLFKGVAEPWRLIEGISSQADYKKGEEIAVADENGRRAGIILSGTARVTKNSAGGRALPMTTLVEGRLFGVAGMFSGEAEGEFSSVTALRATRVLFFPEAEFERLVLSDPLIGGNYIRYLSQRIRFLNRKIDAFTAGNAELKLLLFLSDLAQDGRVRLPFSASECARQLDMGRASFYRALEALEERHIIARDGVEIIILNDQTVDTGKEVLE